MSFCSHPQCFIQESHEHLTAGDVLHHEPNALAALTAENERLKATLEEHKTSGSYTMREQELEAEVALLNAELQIAREAIEKAPHAPYCPTHPYPPELVANRKLSHSCNCWKSVALAAGTDAKEAE